MRDHTGNGSLTIRRSLGRKLKALRAEAKKTPADVSEAQIASRSKLFKIEAGTVPVKMADVRAMCWLYGADVGTSDALAEMALNTAADGWWEDYADAVPRWFTTYIELEGAATSLLQYHAELVPGLLQTADYARATFAIEPHLSVHPVDRQVAVRDARKRAAFDRSSPLQMTAVLSEGALVRQIGGTKVMAEQIAHLLKDQAGVHILPATIGAHAAMTGPFTILDFDDAEDPSVVYLETLAGARYSGSATTVSAYRAVFDSILADAVPLKEWLT